MKNYKFIIPFFFLILFFNTGCRNKPAENDAIPVISAGYEDKGDFRVLYQYFRQNSDAKIVIDQLRKEGVMDNMVKELNSIFKLPYDVLIRFKQSDTANAWYSPETRSIDFTSAFIIEFYDNFAKYYKGDELIHKVTNVVIFFLFHEIGHALTDIYQLSVKGPEEDVVDDFAIYLLSGGDAITQEAVLDGANMFYEYGKRTEDLTVKSLELWDEHSLDQQRFYNILCMMYGSNPEKYSYLISPKLLPQNMTNRCLGDYEKIMRSWHNDLSQYMHPMINQ